MAQLIRTLGSMAVALPLALVVACGSAAEMTGTEGEATSSVVAGEDSSVGDAESGSPSPTAAADAVVLKVEGSGFTQFPKTEYSEPSVSYGAVISNSGSQIATNVQVQVGLEDGSGAVVDSEDKYLPVILPGTSVGVTGTAFEAAGVKKVSVQVLPGQSEPVSGDPGNFEVSKITTKKVEYGGLKTTAVVMSPFTKDLKDLEAVAIYRNAKGKIIGGDFTYLNFVPAKGKASLSIEGPTWEKKPAKTEVYISLSGLSLLE
jgi:hypothetical protein